MFIDIGGVKMDKNYQEDRNKSFPIVSPKDYFDANGYVRTDLFEDKAEKIAKSFSSDDNSKKIKNTQIRKFYDEVLRLKLKIESANNPEEKFKETLPYIKMLIPKVVYSKNRGNANEAFEEFIKSIKDINELQKFTVFCDLFECVVAYCKIYCKDT